MMKRISISVFFLATLALLPGFCVSAQTAVSATAKPSATAPLDTFNYIIGTQVMGSYYQFTDQSLLKEGGDQVLAMGSVRDQIATSIKWGTPFAFYWALYCTSPNDGCWMIDEKGVKEPIYYTYQHYYADARAYVADFEKKSRRKPSDKEFQAYAYKWFTTPEKAAEGKAQ